jgi:hypothetical protein
MQPSPLAVIYELQPDLSESDALQAAYLLSNAQQQGIKLTYSLVEKIIFDVTSPLHRWQ